jgi:integrase/recombinase XerD
MEYSRTTQKLIEILQIKKYSEATIDSYAYHLETFLQFKKERHYTYLSSQDVNDYLVAIKDKSESFLNQAINAIRCLFVYILNRKLKARLVIRPKKAKTSPILLSDSEIADIFNACQNKKHLAIMYLMYGAGLRVSEVINLKIEHIDSKNMLIHIQSGKGKRDRQIMLDMVVLKCLRDYFTEYRPIEYLFNGQNDSPKYSVSSIQQFVKDYASKAGVKKKVHPHIFRHQFITGVLENGGDIHDAQILAGHSDPKTTANVYAHLSPKYIASIKSPIQFLQLSK